MERFSKMLLVAMLLFGLVVVTGTLFNVRDPGQGAGPAVSTPQKFALQQGDMRKFEFSESAPLVAGGPFLNPAGEETNLTAFGGKHVLVNLWATWCAPCIEELPALDRLQAKLGSDAFEVVILSVDRAGLERSQAFLDELGIENLKTYSDKSMALMPGLGVTGLPTTLLIDNRGREIGRLAGIAEWDGEDAVRLIQHFIDQAPVS